jgi:hypothetical protein
VLELSSEDGEIPASVLERESPLSSELELVTLAMLLELGTTSLDEEIFSELETRLELEL